MAKAKLGDFRTQRRNANKHTPRGLGMLEKSVKTDGWIGAMTVAADGETFDGSARLEVLAGAMPEAEPIVVDSDGTRPVVVRRTDIATADDPRAVRLGLGANRIAQVDLEFDAAVLADLSPVVDLSQFWSADELAELMPDASGNDAEDPGAQLDKAAELQAKWGTALGQLWQVGRHRLLVGDCTVAENVARLMGGEKAGAVVTDSPYGINKEGIENDDPEGLRALFDGCLSVLPTDNAVVINFQSPRLFPVWLDAIRDAGQQFERALWFYDETDVTFPWRGWLMTSQIALVSSVGKSEWGKGEYHHDCYMVKTAGKQDDSGGHTTAKPLDVIENLVGHTVGIVYDPFNGSGTTLVACEKLGRIGRGMELSPAYAAVTLERLSGLGLTPELVNA